MDTISISPLTEQCFKIIEGLLAAADRGMALRETQPTVSPSGDLHNFFDDLPSAGFGTREYRPMSCFWSCLFPANHANFM